MRVVGITRADQVKHAVHDLLWNHITSSLGNLLADNGMILPVAAE